MIALLFSEAGRMAAALGAMAIPSAHAQEALPPMVEVAPDVWSTRAEPMPVPPSPKDRSCVRNWRRAYYAAQAADVITTVAGIESGKGKEGNPLYTAIFGKDVKSWQVLALKGVSIGLSEWATDKVLRGGDYAGACTSYKISGGLIGGVALLNIRVFF